MTTKFSVPYIKSRYGFYERKKKANEKHQVLIVKLAITCSGWAIKWVNVLLDFYLQIVNASARES